MSDTLAAVAAGQEPGTQGRLACRLLRKVVSGVRGPRCEAGELELENLSQGAVVIRYQMSPLQYLDLRVTGPSGAVVSERHFGDRFSPQAEERVLRLEPGEKFRSEVPLLSTVPREKRAPGRYLVKAVYETSDIKAASDPVEVII